MLILGRLWLKPSEESVRPTNMYRFMSFINQKYNRQFSEYAPLFQWSIDNIPDFWASMWEFAEIKASRPHEQIIDDIGKMPGAKGFSGSRLNFAENLLKYRSHKPALVFRGKDRVPEP